MSLLNEDLLTVEEVPACLPGNLRPATIWRWVLYGLHGDRLESIVVGGARYTSRQALLRFVEKTTASAEARQKEKAESRAVKSAHCSASKRRTTGAGA